MIRYTSREKVLPRVDNDGTEHWVHYIQIKEQQTNAPAEKLCNLEDREEEIGVDLNKLLSAKEIYYMEWANGQDDSLKIAKTFKVYLNITDNRIEFLENEFSDIPLFLETQNYGRKDIWGGWAFTKEELE